jgi:surface-adhesin protein E
MMQRLLLLSLFVLTSTPASGEWVLVDRNDQLGMSVYVDPDTIRRRGDMVDMWALYDYRETQTRRSGDPYSSRKVQSEYMCTEKVKRLIKVEEFSGHMGSGEVVHKQSYLFSTEQSKWTQINLGGGESLWKMACKKD